MRLRLRGQAGFTIVETMAASFVLVLGILATVSLIDGAQRTTSMTQAREAANSLARELVESARTISFEDLSTATFPTKLQVQPGLEDASAGGTYDIVRRGVTFSVAGSVCTMDDTADGVGSRGTGSAFCSDAPAAGTADKNPEDYKRVSVTLSWQGRGQSAQRVTQTSVVNNPGSAQAPAVRSLEPSGFTLPVTTGLTTLTFKAVTSSKPKTIAWMVDGAVQSPAPTASDSTNLVYSFQWNISAVDDGSYLISAEAFNANALSGPTRSLTVLLNRYAPRTPTNVTAGFNRFGYAEIEWSPNTERDIVGYTVTRLSDGVVVCSVQPRAECVDKNPPGGGSDLQYSVVALDSDTAGVPRAGSAATATAVRSNNAPGKIGAGAKTFSFGRPQLTWTRPSSPVDPDGDGVLWYWVYRDGTSYADRYDRWFDNAANVTWTDYDAGGADHNYYVAAVDTRYMEHSPVEIKP